MIERRRQRFETKENDLDSVRRHPLDAICNNRKTGATRDLSARTRSTVEKTNCSSVAEQTRKTETRERIGKGKKRERKVGKERQKSLVSGC